jgi:hypothetical protein
MNMSRTIGAKDKAPRKSPVRKPKKIKLTKAEVDLAAKMGVTPQQLAIEKLKLQRKPRKPRATKVNWERLARNLQTALRDEIVENQKRANDIDALLFKIKSLEHQAIGFQAVISYLETKSGNNTV